MKKKCSVNISQQLYNDLKNYTSVVIKDTAQTVKDELVFATRVAITMFYADYRPLYYSRHYFNFENYSYSPYYKNPHNTIIRGGVVISYEKMKDIYEQPLEYVFSNVMFGGIHGDYSLVHKKLQPSPVERIYKKRDEIISNINRYINNSQQKAIDLVYKTFVAF